MSALRKLALVLLVTLLAVDLAAANAVVAVDRTVLNPGFVTSTLEEEEGAYEQAEPIVLEQLPTEDLEGAENGSAPLPIDTRSVLSEALDPDYLQSALEPNIERTYAYLHGNREELELVIDLEPAKAAMADAIEVELTNASAAELLRTVAGGEASLAVPVAGVELDLFTAAEMSENESTFRAEREALRETVRDRVVTRAIDRTFTNASNDDLLELVIDDYDTSEYTESEKEALVDDHEAEIRTALRERIEEESSGEIQAEVDD